MRALYPLITLLTLVCHSDVAWPNAAPPWRGGDSTGEPNGLQDVRIERETLSIDLRPAVDGNAALVKAVYQIQNSGPEVTTDLVFVAGTPVDDFSAVTLDDETLTAMRQPAPKDPPSWQPPETTPGVDEYRKQLPYVHRNRSNEAMVFRVTLKPGSHTLMVRYGAKLTEYSGSAPTRYWQLAYILAPAREWGGFGGLDVSVDVPPGWLVATDPALKREGDRLTGSFDSLPADALTITTRMPWVDRQPVYDGVWRGVALAGLVVCPLLGWYAGRRLGLAGQSSGWAWLVSLGAAVLWAVLLAGLTMVGEGADSVPQSQAAWNRGLEGFVRFVGGMGVALLALPLGLLLTQVTAWLACRAARQATLP